MTLKKAIKELIPIHEGSRHTITPDLFKAIKLGREALKEVKRLRSYQVSHVKRILEGETKD